MNVDNRTIKARDLRWGSPVLFAQSSAKGPFATDFLIVNVNDTRPNKFKNPTPLIVISRSASWRMGKDLRRGVQ